MHHVHKHLFLLGSWEKWQSEAVPVVSIIGLSSSLTPSHQAHRDLHMAPGLAPLHSAHHHSADDEHLASCPRVFFPSCAWPSFCKTARPLNRNTTSSYA